MEIAVWMEVRQMDLQEIAAVYVPMDSLEIIVKYLLLALPDQTEYIAWMAVQQ